MEWKIEGADYRSGKEVNKTIEAESQEEAEKYCRDRGIVVASITISQLGETELTGPTRSGSS